MGDDETEKEKKKNPFHRIHSNSKHAADITDELINEKINKKDYNDEDGEEDEIENFQEGKVTEHSLKKDFKHKMHTKLRRHMDSNDEEEIDKSFEKYLENY